MPIDRLTWSKVPTAHTARERSKRNEIRHDVYKRSGGLCELGTHRDCILGVLPFSGNSIHDHGYLISRDRTLNASTCYWVCWRCALCVAPAPKPIPPPSPAWIDSYYGN